MTSRPQVRAALLACLAAGTAAACSGSDGVASPGEGVFVTSPPASPPASPPTSPPASPPTSPPTSGPAASCPTGTTSVGTITTTAGEMRNCRLPARITGATSLELSEVAGVIYSLSGRTDVGDDQGANPSAPIAGRESGTLVMNEGVTLFGSTSSDYLVVNRGSQIFVNGASDNPVIMTGREDVTGSAQADADQQWGGLIILGRAPITTCPAGATDPTLDAPNIACETQIEGADFALYGGASHADDSGSINYLRVQFGGVEIGAGNEINGITMGGVGAGTEVSNIQVHANFDDGVELFGGRVNISNMVLTSIGDDSFDLDLGWVGAAQNIIVVQESGRGDHIFEFGDVDATSLTTYSKISNATLISSDRDEVVDQKEDHQMDLYNTVIVNANAASGIDCLALNNATGVGLPTYNSVVLDCAVDFGGSEGTANGTQFAAGANNDAGFTNSLTSTFVNGASENGVTATAPVNHDNGANAAASTFLTTPSNIGAVYPGNDTWYQGWTCGIAGQPAC